MTSINPSVRDDGTGEGHDGGNSGDVEGGKACVGFSSTAVKRGAVRLTADLSQPRNCWRHV
jgi:hypothetical protein